MFVFKAAVVGAGTMGGEIAQTIAAADIPVRAQGRRPRSSVDQGLAKARSLWQAQVDAGKLAAAEPERQPRPDHRHHRTTRGSATSTS